MLKSFRLTAAPCLVLLALMSGCTEPEQTPTTSSTPTSSLSTDPASTPVASTWRCWKSLDREWETLDYGYPRSKPGGSDSDCVPVK